MCLQWVSIFCFNSLTNSKCDLVEKDSLKIVKVVEKSLEEKS